jgi:hypothetical protein
MNGTRKKMNVSFVITPKPEINENKYKYLFFLVIKYLQNKNKERAIKKEISGISKANLLEKISLGLIANTKDARKAIFSL